MKLRFLKRHKKDELPVKENFTHEQERKPKKYEAPTVIVHDADEFIATLGPAQACSGDPVLWAPAPYVDQYGDPLGDPHEDR